MVVLDASAIIAYLLDEEGADVVEAQIATGEAHCSTVNLAEVLSVFSDAGAPPEDVAARLELLVSIDPFDEAQALESARLRKLTKRAGLSLGDRSCLALGRVLGAAVLTADRAWAGLGFAHNLTFIR